MEECIRLAFDESIDAGIEKIVMFTGTGEGPMWAQQHLLPITKFVGLSIVAVSPPVGRLYPINPWAPPAEDNLVEAGVPRDLRDFLSTVANIAVVARHLPFKSIGGFPSEWTRVEQAYGILGGGFALCIQAILSACDAGEVLMGERVTALTADTAIMAIASRSESFLSPEDGLLLEHIICRPARYTITKPNHIAYPRGGDSKVPDELPSLPSHDDEQ